MLKFELGIFACRSSHAGVSSLMSDVIGASGAKQPPKFAVDSDHSRSVKLLIDLEPGPPFTDLIRRPSARFRRLFS